LLLGKLSMRNYDVRVVEDKVFVDISKAQEGLDLLEVLWGWPFEDSIDLGLGHGDPVR